MLDTTRARGLLKVGRFLFCGENVFLFYVDESGSPDRHDEPLKDGQTPIFVLGSLVFQADKWRALDRAYRALKMQFFKKEIGTRRPEQYEIKGSDLIGPRNRDSQRRHYFIRKVLGLCVEYHGYGFAVIFKKNAVTPTSKAALYTMALQYLCERFNIVMEEVSKGIEPRFAQEHAQGIIIADSRMRNLDFNVALSHLTFVFGNPIGQRCLRMIEAPTFTHSQLSVGIQLADIFSSCMYAQAYRRNCKQVAGALDYSHMSYLDNFQPFECLQYRSQQAYDGYYKRGDRFIDHSEPAGP